MTDLSLIRGSFPFPTEIVDEFNWVTSSFIESSFGVPCQLVFPSKWSECTNCKIDLSTGRSSGIYKSDTGTISFQNHQICPLCQGRGRRELPQTEDVRFRVYWNTRDWIDINVPIASPDSTAMLIGFLSDLPALEKADKIILHTDLQEIRQYSVRREGEAVPHGIAKNHFFIQYVTRSGGG